MLAVIVGTHGHFAEELVKTCAMICGAAENLKTVALIPGEGAEDLMQKYQEALQNLDTVDGVIFLNDLFGGSPYNAACRIAANEENYGIITGVNLPMLVEVLSIQASGEAMPVEKVMERALEAGAMGLQKFHKNQVKQTYDEL